MSEHKQTKSYYKEILDELESASITHQNFDKYSSKVDQLVGMTESNINRLEHDYLSHKDDYTNQIDDDSIKDAMRNDRIVPLETHKSLRDAFVELQKLNEQAVWQKEVLHLEVIKLRAALKESKSLEIQSAFLNNLKEYLQREKDFNKQILMEITEKWNHRHSDMKDWAVGQFNLFRKEVLQEVRSILSENQLPVSDKIKNPEEVSYKERIIPSPVITQDKETESDDDGFDVKIDDDEVFNT